MKLLSIFNNMRDRDFRREGILVGEGKYLFERICGSDLEIIGALASDRMERYCLDYAGNSFPVVSLPDSEIQAIAGFPFHRGVLIAAKRPGDILIEDGLKNCPEMKRIVICPNLTNDENLGSIIRTAAALGYDALAMGTRSCDPFSRKALKVSMGAALTLPIWQMENIIESLDFCRRKGFTIFGTVLDGSAQLLNTVSQKAPVAVLFGNEANGLDESLKNICDVKVCIPMNEGVDSLNVAVSAGIVLHHFAGLS